MPQSWPMRVFGLLSRDQLHHRPDGRAVILLATVIFILVDIFLREFAGRGLGGSDEISGYVIAGVAAWGFSYALVERAHVRIDVLTGQLPAAGRAIFDLAAAASLTFVAALVTSYGWRVFHRSWETGFARQYAAGNTFVAFPNRSGWPGGPGSLSWPQW